MYLNLEIICELPSCITGYGSSYITGNLSDWPLFGLATKYTYTGYKVYDILYMLYNLTYTT